MIRTEIHGNDEGFFRVKVFGYMDSSNLGRWLTDSDTMSLISSSHKSKELTFTSATSAQKTASQFEEKMKLLQLQTSVHIEEKNYSDTWQKIDEDKIPKLGVYTSQDGGVYSKIEEVQAVLKWVKKKSDEKNK